MVSFPETYIDPVNHTKNQRQTRPSDKGEPDHPDPVIRRKTGWPVSQKNFRPLKNKGSRGPSPGSANGNGHFARWKVIRILDLGKLFLVESNFLEFFFCGIRNPGLWNPESSSVSLESR